MGGLERILPAFAQAHGGVDQADHRIGLREIAPQRVGARIDVFRQQAEGVAQLQRFGEQRPRLIPAPDGVEGIDVPEIADQKGGFRQPKVVSPAGAPPTVKLKLLTEP